MNKNDFYFKAFMLLTKAKASGLSEEDILEEFRYARKRIYK